MLNPPCRVFVGCLVTVYGDTRGSILTVSVLQELGCSGISGISGHTYGSSVLFHWHVREMSTSILQAFFIFLQIKHTVQTINGWRISLSRMLTNATHKENGKSDVPYEWNNGLHTRPVFWYSCRAVARELIRKQAEGCKLLFTIHTVEEICIDYNYLYNIIVYLNGNNKI